MIRPLSSPAVRFAVLTDVHFPAAPGDRETAAARLQAGVERCNAHGLDFVVQLGDLIDGGFETFDAALAILSRVDGDVVHVLGNHDFDVDADRLDDVPRRLGLTTRYYSFVREGLRFVVLDGNDVSLHAHPEGSLPRRMAESMLAVLADQGGPEAEPFNGAIGRRQVGWLADQLTEADQAEQRVIVLNHFPIWPPSRYALWNGPEILDLLTGSARVALYLNGHAHEASDEGCEGIRFVTAPALGLPDLTPGLTLVEISGDGIDVQFLSLQGDP